MAPRNRRGGPPKGAGTSASAKDDAPAGVKREDGDMLRLTLTIACIVTLAALYIGYLTITNLPNQEQKFFSHPDPKDVPEKEPQKEEPSVEKNSFPYDSRLMELFKRYDVDGDDFISPSEFVAVYEAIQELESGMLRQQSSPPSTLDDAEMNDAEAGSSSLYDEKVLLQAEMRPVDLSSMKQAEKFEKFGEKDQPLPDEFRGLLAWRDVARPEMELPARAFAAFLPPEGDKARLATPYWLFTASPRQPTSSDRFRPPGSYRDRAEQLIHQLLLMLHPRPFVHMRFSPQGGAAVVSKMSDLYLTINFRLHCEFQLNDEGAGSKPFWFTPAQFAGELVMTRDGEHLRHFRLEVPALRKLNVDMEWFLTQPANDDDVMNGMTSEDGAAEEDEMEVDIGYLPLMRIAAQGPSSPQLLIDEDGSVLDRRKLREEGKDVELHFDEIKWSSEINEQEAVDLLDRFFNPFKQVEYMNFPQAVNACRATSRADDVKLLHHVVLWGSLDDQSC